MRAPADESHRKEPARDPFAALLGFAFAGLFFTGAAPFMFHQGFGPPPLWWLIVLGFVTVPLLARKEALETAYRSGSFAWVGCALALTASSYLWSSQSPTAADELLRRILSSITLLYGVLLFSVAAARQAAFFVVWGAVFVGTALNLVDAVAPMTMSEVFGRSAGLYGNPNTAGMALLCALLLTLPRVPQRSRALVYTVAALGIFLTLSRGVLLSLGMATLLLWWQDKLSMRKVTAALSVTILVSAAVSVMLFGTEAIAIALRPLLTSGTIARITDLANTTGGINYSTNERLEALKSGLSLFADNPLLGAGVGSTHEMRIGVSTHNIFAKQLAEYGPLGLALLLSLFTIARRSAARSPTDAESFQVIAPTLLLLGLFTHNMLDDWSLCIVFALMLSAPTSNRPEDRQPSRD